MRLVKGKHCKTCKHVVEFEEFEDGNIGFVWCEFDGSSTVVSWKGRCKHYEPREADAER